MHLLLDAVNGWHSGASGNTLELREQMLLSRSHPCLEKGQHINKYDVNRSGSKLFLSEETRPSWKQN